LLTDLADALLAVPGKVIVILESCGSGAAVYSNGDSRDRWEEGKTKAVALDEAAIRAFSQADPGIVVQIQANTGEFRRENKFYVLSASRYQESSWGTDDGPYNHFTYWLTNGVGTSGKMPADTNSDYKLTLNELYKYISQVGDDVAFYNKDDGLYYYQHVQVYPANSSFVLFKRWKTGTIHNGDGFVVCS